jgi:penicillin-binding protein 1C
MTEPGASTARKIPRWRRVALALCLVAGGLTAGGALYMRSVIGEIAASLPPTPELASLPVSVAVVDRDGQLLRPFTTKDGRWRLPVTSAQVDRRFIDMLVAYEDRGFAGHHGVEWGAMLRAAGQYVGAGGNIVSGGSTLTMQVARLIEGGATRNLWGKLRQMVHADSLERQLSKDQILNLYLTLAPYGGNIEGIRAASLAYFGKEPTRLTTAEAALLVALPQSPEARRPDRDPEAARRSRDMVLDRLVAAGAIAAEEAEAAKHEPIPIARKQFPMLASHMAEQALRAQPGVRQIGLTVDKRLQDALERLGAARARQIDPKVSVAIVAADIQTGEVLASVGSAGLFNAESAGYVDMTSAIRSPGSTLKPLIYGLAFELGPGASRKPDRGPADRLWRLCAGQFRRLQPGHGDDKAGADGIAQYSGRGGARCSGVVAADFAHQAGPCRSAPAGQYGAELGGGAGWGGHYFARPGLHLWGDCAGRFAHGPA